MEDNHPEYPQGPIKSVTYAPAGAGTGRTVNNQEDLVGSAMWNKYMKHIFKNSHIIWYANDSIP